MTKHKVEIWQVAKDNAFNCYRGWRVPLIVAYDTDWDTDFVKSLYFKAYDTDWDTDFVKS